MRKEKAFILGLLTLILAAGLVPAEVLAKGSRPAETGDPAILALMHQINERLAADGFDFALGQIELYTIGKGRPINRILQNGFRWVAGDQNRLAQGDDITYLVDQSDGATASGLSNAQIEAAIDRAMTTWEETRSLEKLDIVKRPDLGFDPDIFDEIIGLSYFGDPDFFDETGPGNPFLADIVHAGWMPWAFFEALVTGGGEGTLAVSVTFYWVDAEGNPVDANGDNYVDTALNEVYYNDYFGYPSGTREGNPWGINSALPGVDVESVALHESGHSLGLDHFGPPPEAIMNPVYGGMRQSPHSTDMAAMCIVWASWPK